MSQSICTQCGHVGNPKKVTKGSFIIEIILWCLFLVPGLIYTIWRVSSRYKVCPNCKGTMIPTDSPVGKKLIAEHKTA